MTDEPELHYVLHVIPPGRLPFQRWRYELWHGPRLVAAGWRTTEDHAERALSTKAARLAHRLRGLHLLRPEAVTASRPLRHGVTARVEGGAVSCLLIPLSALPARSAA